MCLLVYPLAYPERSPRKWLSCLLVSGVGPVLWCTLRRAPEEGLSASLLYACSQSFWIELWEKLRGKAGLPICNTSPGALRGARCSLCRVPGEGFMFWCSRSVSWYTLRWVPWGVCSLPPWYSKRGAWGRLVCIYVACPLESKLGSLEKACFVLSLCGLSCHKQGEPTEKVKVTILHLSWSCTPSSFMQFSNPLPHFTSHGNILY